MLKYLLYLALSAVCFAGKQPNIVFLFSDDHALSAISAYGSKTIETPNIDRIAKEGAIFNNSFCTNSICGPSRATILTGKHSHLNGFTGNLGADFDGYQTTLPRLMQDAGYQTAIFGKWHLKSTPVGFDRWEIFPDQGNYYNPDLLQQGGGKKRYEGYATDIVTDLSLKWLKEERDPNRPFILFCQHKAPHRTFAPALRHLNLYDDKDIPVPSTFFDDYKNRSQTLAKHAMGIADHMAWDYDLKVPTSLVQEYNLPGRNHIKDVEYPRMTPEQKEAWDKFYEPRNREMLEKWKAGKMTEKDLALWRYQRYVKNYLRTVTSVDENIGRVLDYLDQNNLTENTIVIYSADQGFYVGEHGWFDKRWMFEESFKMPFLIRWPSSIKPGQKHNELIQNIDYAPTLLSAAGVAVPAEMQGKSILPLVEGGSTEWRDALYYAYYDHGGEHQVPQHDGIRTDRYKLIHFPHTKEWNLFDLKNDPNELVSIHDKNPELLKQLQAKYEELKKEYHVSSATIPSPRPQPWWKERHKLLNKRTKEGAGKAEIVFIGDSITQSWENHGKAVWEKYYAPRNAVNLGISGDRTEHLMWRLQNGNFTGLTPKVAVVMIGTNNTGHSMQPAEETAQGIRAILDQIHSKSPDTKILLLGVFPRDEKPDGEKRLRNNEINNIIKNYADGKTVFYQDISKVFLDGKDNLPKGIMPDFLHPRQEGYKSWAEAIEPTLLKLGLKPLNE